MTTTTVRASFEYRGDTSTKSVALAGSWNGWQPEPMVRAQNEPLWTSDQDVSPGTIQFKFVVDNEWVSVDNYDVTDDGHGAFNNVCVIEFPAEKLEMGDESGNATTNHQNEETSEVRVDSKIADENLQDAVAEDALEETKELQVEEVEKAPVEEKEEKEEKEEEEEEEEEEMPSETIACAQAEPIQGETLEPKKEWCQERREEYRIVSSSNGDSEKPRRLPSYEETPNIQQSTEGELYEQLPETVVATPRELPGDAFGDASTDDDGKGEKQLGEQGKRERNANEKVRVKQNQSSESVPPDAKRNTSYEGKNALQHEMQKATHEEPDELAKPKAEQGCVLM